MVEPGKTELRARLSEARRARPTQEIEAARAAVRTRILERCATTGWRCVAAYVPLRTEPGSFELLDAMAAVGIRVLVPVVLPDRSLDWADWAAPDSGTGALGADEIAKADAVLVPALAVAFDGTRLGRGGGSYDRALPLANPDSPRVVLVYDDEVLPSLPREPWDFPVTALVTPTRSQDLPID